MLYYYLCELSMPWARSFCPLPLLYPSASDFQFPSAGDRWFRACGAYMRNLYYGNYNFSYYSFFLRGIWGLKVVTICYYKYLYINIYYYIFIYTFLYLHFKSVILGQNKTVITEIVICNRFLAVSRCILSLPLKLCLSHHKAMSYDPQNDELFSLTQYGRNINGISHNSAR